jgi:hypothetical protein
MTATASSTKGTKVCVLKGASTATALTPTSITKAKPAVVTVAAVTGLSVGDLVSFPATGATGATGISSLDGKSWVIGSIDATAKTFTLAGSDTTTDTGTLAATPSINAYPNAANMLCLCLSSITFNPGEASTVSVATFCDPTASIPSQVVEAGTIDIGGYVDITDPGYIELLAAQADGKSRTWRVTLGNNQGYILFDGILSTLSLDIPLDGATAYSGTITLGSAYRHLF